MERISATQLAFSAAEKLVAQSGKLITLPANPPSLVWVVRVDDDLVGVFGDWASASACIGGLEKAQKLKSHLAKLAKRERDNLNSPGAEP
jgi:hypothetical protein